MIMNEYYKHRKARKTGAEKSKIRIKFIQDDAQKNLKTRFS